MLSCGLSFVVFGCQLCVSAVDSLFTVSWLRDMPGYHIVSRRCIWLIRATTDQQSQLPLSTTEAVDTLPAFDIGLLAQCFMKEECAMHDRASLNCDANTCLRYVQTSSARAAMGTFALVAGMCLAEDATVVTCDCYSTHAMHCAKKVRLQPVLHI
jgi:hypothetical protein